MEHSIIKYLDTQEVVVQNSKTYKRIIIGVVVGFVLLIVGISAANIIWGKIYSVTLDLMIAPTDSTIMVNGELMKAGEHRVKPGEYKIEVSRDGFESEVKLVLLEEGETKNVLMALTPNDPSTMDWYYTHEEDATIADGVASQEYVEYAEEMAEEEDIVENLPVYTYGYILGYGDCSEKEVTDFCVVIRAEFGYRDEAVEYLRGTGKDLAKYRVEVLRHESPFVDATVSIPDGLKFDENASESANREVLDTESAAIFGAINNRARLKNSYDIVKALEVACFGGGEYCVAKVAVYDGEQYYEALGNGFDPEDSSHDTYRMVIAKIDGTWRVVSDLKFLLNYEDNLKLPQEIVRLANEF